MIFTLQHIFPAKDASTIVDGKWVRANPSPYQGGVFTRIWNAFAVLFSDRVYAVRWPKHGELERILDLRQESIVANMDHEKHVLHRAHEIGMHKQPELVCADCFQDALDRYTKICLKLLKAADFEDQSEAFRAHMKRIVRPCEWLIFNEHPAYFLGSFLKLDHHSPEFASLVRHSIEARKD